MPHATTHARHLGRISRWKPHRAPVCAAIETITYTWAYASKKEEDTEQKKAGTAPSGHQLHQKIAKGAPRSPLSHLLSAHTLNLTIPPLPRHAPGCAARAEAAISAAVFVRDPHPPHRPTVGAFTKVQRPQGMPSDEGGAARGEPHTVHSAAPGAFSNVHEGQAMTSAR